MSNEAAARVIAFYLPQYHPIPENDAWWGAGFTEWTVVSRAEALYRGHQQPKRPGELGFYDLRVPEVREAQAGLARAHGIEGFCYWHYWLGNGRRLLERPFQEVLHSGRPDFPFCLGWANHSWQGVFFGAGGRTLIEQQYPGDEDSRAHFDSLLPAFMDRRYIHVDGRPLFYIYRPHEVPDLPTMIRQWQEWARQKGLRGLYIIGEGMNRQQGDAAGLDGVSYSNHRLIGLQREMLPPLKRLRLRLQLARGWPEIYDYTDAARLFLKPGPTPAGEYPSLVTNWDNTPRFGRRGVVLAGSTPALFARHVRDALERSAAKPRETRILFLKSWNEWAEGNYIEPDEQHGRAYLEALRDALCRGNGVPAGEDT